MIAIRSDEEIEKIRKAGSILADTLAKLKKSISPGVRTSQLDSIARETIMKASGYPAFKGYKGFPANICTSINEVVVHGIPSDRKLADGDIVSIDIGVKYGDYFADAAETFGVGKISENAKRLIDTTRRALDAGMAQAIPGRRISDISAAIQSLVESAGFSVVRSLVGHGIGTSLHEEPEVPNFGHAGTGPRLQPGMVLAIEPMVNAGHYEVEVLEDGWAVATADRRLSAHFEHTIVITDSGSEILTKR